MGSSAVAPALAREALELLSLLDDPDARRALGALPLELTGTPEPAWLPERDLPSEAWRSIAGWLSLVEPERVAAAGRRVVEAIAAELDPEDEPPASAHVGLHTGPHGALVIAGPDAAAWFPLSALVTRAASDDAPSWPAALEDRSKVRLCAELAGIDWRAVWAARWLTALEGDRAAGAAACVGAYAEGVLGRSATRRLFRDGLSLGAG